MPAQGTARGFRGLSPLNAVSSRVPMNCSPPHSSFSGSRLQPWAGSPFPMSPQGYLSGQLINCEHNLTVTMAGIF